MAEFLADCPDWHLWSWSCVCLSLFSTAVDEWSGSFLPELHGINSCGQGAEEDATGSAKTFPDIPCVSQMLGGPCLRLGIPFERLSSTTKNWMRWERHKLTGNVGMSTAYWFSILKISWIIHTINFILQFLYRTSKFQKSVLVLDQSSSCYSVESRTLKLPSTSSISVRLFSWASRRSQFCFNNCSWSKLLSMEFVSAWARWSSSCLTARSFNLIFVSLCRSIKSPGIRVLWYPPDSRFWFADLLSVQRELPNPFMFKVWLFDHCFNNGLHRSIGHWRRRLTNRQAFSLGVIDLFSECIEEHLTELRHHRNPRPRGTVARGTVARSWTPDWTRRTSLWGSSPWAHNLCLRRTRQ